MWKGPHIVHGGSHYPQSQGSVKRSNQDAKQLLGILIIIRSAFNFVFISLDLATWIRQDSCTKWSQGLHFVQFQKNSYHHRMIKHSPYSVLFGQEPKVGLSSTILHPSLFNIITTEEELRDELGVPAVDLNTTDEVASGHEVEELFHDDNKKSNQEEDDQLLEKDDIEHVRNLLNGRFERRHSLRQDAPED